MQLFSSFGSSRAAGVYVDMDRVEQLIANLISTQQQQAQLLNVQYHWLAKLQQQHIEQQQQIDTLTRALEQQSQQTTQLQQLTREVNTIKHIVDQVVTLVEDLSVNSQRRQRDINQLFVAIDTLKSNIRALTDSYEDYLFDVFEPQLHTHFLELLTQTIQRIRTLTAPESQTATSSRTP